MRFFVVVMFNCIRFINKSTSHWNIINSFTHSYLLRSVCLIYFNLTHKQHYYIYLSLSNILQFIYLCVEFIISLTQSIQNVNASFKPHLDSKPWQRD